MNLKKWIPWNWFKKEEDDSGKIIPLKRETAQKHGSTLANPIQQFHQEIDQLFDQVLRGFGLAQYGTDRPMISRLADGMFKPTLDLGASDKEYTITVEIPGVDEKDVKLEISNDTLIIRGEKKHKKEEKAKDYYRLERSYGTFQRVLSMPEDVDQKGVKAIFKKGVLTVRLPRKVLPKSDIRQIEIKSD